MSRSSGHAPLVWFTTLAIAGAGMIAAAAWHLPSALTSGALGLTAGTLALAAGLLVSMLHLGRRSRALLAARGTGRSHLSGEIVLAGATLAVGLGMLAMYSQAQREPLARTAAGAIAVLFLLSIGRVYRLKGQRTWRGASILLPLTTGLVCGEVFLWAVGDATFSEASVAGWLIPFDVVLFALRWRMLVRTVSAGVPRRVEAGRIHRLCAARLLIFDLLPFVLLQMNEAPVAFVAVAGGLVLDRWLFYALASQHTTDAEIASVEALIERES